MNHLYTRYFLLGLLSVVLLVPSYGHSFKSPDTNPQAMFLFATDDDQPYDTEQAVSVSENDTVLVIGTTDIRGSDAYNMDLGLRRAKAVSLLLKVKPLEIGVVSYGYHRPEVVCKKIGSECLQPNRRAVVVRTCGLANFPCTSGYKPSYAQDIPSQREQVILQQGFHW